MTIKEALSMVFELAEQNVLHDDIPIDMMEHKEEQEMAVEKVRQLLDNEAVMEILKGFDD